MITLGEKINLIMEYIVAGDAETQFQLKEKITQALCDDTLARGDYILDDLVDDFLTEIGMPCHLIGYIYARTALKMIMIDPTYLNAITGRLYPQIAKQNESTPSRVERTIRHAVEVTWSRINLNTMDRLFGSIADPSKGKPTNVEFLATCHKILSRRLRDMK